MLYRKMRYPWCNYALMKEYRDNILVRKMTAHQHSNFALKYKKQQNMKTIEGHDVKVFTDNIKKNALGQIRELLSIDVISDKKIRIMPDIHT